jgi:hypothetical protein
MEIRNDVSTLAYRRPGCGGGAYLVAAAAAGNAAGSRAISAIRAAYTP